MNLKNMNYNDLKFDIKDKDVEDIFKIAEDLDKNRRFMKKVAKYYKRNEKKATMNNEKSASIFSFGKKDKYKRVDYIEYNM